MKCISEAVEVLKSGGIIIYPTETVYAIGCLVTHADSIKKLYEIKHRDSSQPTSVIVSSLELATNYVKFNQAATRLASEFWPGPLTMCLPVVKEVPEVLLGPDNTLGMRVPGNAWTLDLAKLAEVPILAPSANFKGEKPPATFGEIDKRLIELVDYVVDTDPSGQKPSTIVTFDNKGNPEIIREGAINKKAVFETLGKDKKYRAAGSLDEL